MFLVAATYFHIPQIILVKTIQITPGTPKIPDVPNVYGVMFITIPVRLPVNARIISSDRPHIDEFNSVFSAFLFFSSVIRTVSTAIPAMDMTK